SEYPAVSNIELTNCILDTCKELNFPYHYGIVRSHDSFYTEKEEDIKEFWNTKGVLGSDMETAVLFTIAELRGVRAASILNSVVEYESDLKDGIGNYVAKEEKVQKGENKEIKLALETIYKIDKLNY
ncbi:MAG TPA: nucleoside phosphorylase, partial [Tissierellales bacterium]|nr:nucleoside phosphorylase [Tissierellales bacterium]